MGAGSSASATIDVQENGECRVRLRPQHSSMTADTTNLHPSLSELPDDVLLHVFYCIATMIPSDDGCYNDTKAMGARIPLRTLGNLGRAHRRLAERRLARIDAEAAEHGVARA